MPISDVLGSFQNFFLNGSYSEYATCWGSASYGFASSPIYPIPFKYITIIIVHHLCWFCTCFHVSFYFWTCTKTVYFYINVLLRCGLILKSLFWTFCSFACIILCSLFAVWVFMLSGCNLSQLASLTKLVHCLTLQIN